MQSQLPRESYDTSDEISLRELWRVFREGWKIVVGVALGVSTLTAAATFLVRPVFRAEAVIQEVASAGTNSSAGQALLGQFGGLAQLAGVDLSSLQPGPANGRTLLRSRTFVEKFISDKNLLPQIFPNDWDPATNNWRPDARPHGVAEGAERFKKEVFSVVDDPDSGLLTLRVEWTDAQTAADWANDLITLGNDIARTRDISDAERSVKFLNDQIQQTNVVEIQRVLYNLLETQLRTLILANGRAEYAFQVVDRAIPPIYRARPRRTFLTAIGLTFGVILGIGFVFIRRVPALLRERASLRA